MASEVVQSLCAKLLTMTAVTDLVGTGNDARIESELAQDVSVPANGTIVVELDSTNPSNDLGGLGGLDYHDVNILVRAPTPAAATALAEAIRRNGTDPGTGLAGYSGTPIDTKIDATLEGTTGPTKITRGDGSARPWWDINMSFEVSHNEVV